MRRLVAATYLSLVMVLVVSCAGFADSAVDAAATTPKLVNIELNDTSVTSGLKVLFNNSGMKCVIDPSVSGKIVELRLKGITFEQALNAFVDAAKLTYTYENGVYYIRPIGSTSNKSTLSVTEQRTPAKKRTENVAAQPEQQEPQYDQEYDQGYYPPQMAQNPNIYVNQTAPAYYGQGGMGAYPYPAYGYGYGPGAYNAGGALNIVDGYGYPVTIGGGTYVRNFGYPNLPPPGILPYAYQQGMSRAWVMTPQPYFIGTGYGY